MARSRRYMELPRGKRRDRFVAIRWRIANDDQGQGLFTCRHLLPGTRGWRELGLGDDLRQTHSDVWFLSQQRAREGVWYTASISTVDQAVAEWLSEEIEAAIEEEGGPDRMEYGADAWRELGRRWGEITVSKWRQAPIWLGCSVDFSYSRGVRVEAIVDNNNLDPDVIAGFINAFNHRGEGAWQEPVDWDRHDGDIATMVDQQVALYARMAESRGLDQRQRSEGSIQ